MTKSEIRRHKVGKFTAVPQAMLRDAELSDKEVGIYARILALPECKKNGEPFEFSVEGYCQMYHGSSRKGCKLIYSGLNALVDAGWIDRWQEKSETGRWGKVVYDLLPEKRPKEEIPHTEKRQAEKGDAIKWDSEKGEKINIERNNTEERSSLKPTFSKKNTDVVLDVFCETFRKRWNFEHDKEKTTTEVLVRNDYGESIGTKKVDNYKTATCRFTSITKKRKELLRKIWEAYQIPDNVNGGTKLYEEMVLKGIQNAMSNNRAQGLAKGMTAPADLDYMLENFVKLVEGTF